MIKKILLIIVMFLNKLVKKATSIIDKYNNWYYICKKCGKANRYYARKCKRCGIKK